MLPLCLVVSADLPSVCALHDGLKGQGMKLYGVADLASARPLLRQWRFDVVLCDAGGMPPGILEGTIRSLRDEQPAPIVVLAAGDDEDGLMAALEAGAAGLLARSTSVRLTALQLQRLVDLAAGAGDAEPRPVSLGELKLDPRRARAMFANRPLPLTGGEFELLLLLAARSNSSVNRGTIMRMIGRAGSSEPRRSADMHVCRIRRKLKEAGATSLSLETIHGQGYALRLREDAPPR